jgi:SAM-dependent methyltransferase
MGITLSKLQNLREIEVLPDRGTILDIGSSNLYGADARGLESFAAAFGRKLNPNFIDRFAAGSVYGPGITKNESFAGELLEQVGLEYLAFDIANGYHTQIFDLNREALADKLRSAFDVVLNFGTTEHVFDQLNSFRVIHDAVKVGGHIVHQLPAVGYIDHGYFCYTPRFFFDLAGHNEYQVVQFSYEGPADGADLFGIVNDYATYFPALREIRRESIAVQNFAINIIIRKTKDLPLRLPMETSTSVYR